MAEASKCSFVLTPTFKLNGFLGLVGSSVVVDAVVDAVVVVVGLSFSLLALPLASAAAFFSAMLLILA